MDSAKITLRLLSIWETCNLRASIRSTERSTMWNIIIGIGMIIGGATGKLVLVGTQSSAALVVLGVGLVGWGIYKKVQNKE